MSKTAFFQSLKNEVARIDTAQITKRNEHLIENFTQEPSPKAIIAGKAYRIFNSNDYLGLRHHLTLKTAEREMTDRCGTGPGAVRFISGSFTVHNQLEKALAMFHGRDDCMVFSSAFATNLAVLFSLIKGQNKDSLVDGNTLVVSDELNHRSIIDGIRLANLDSAQKPIFKHMDMNSLSEVLSANVGKFTRVVVVTDGIFSMLGEFQNLQQMRTVVDEFDSQYDQGVLLVVDDCHGIAAFGNSGRGTEEVSGGNADVLVGTLGKGFGADGGYVVADQVVIDYLRESAATYIYSNSISPGTAAAALAAVNLVNSQEGMELLKQLSQNIAVLKKKLNDIGIVFAAESTHAIQPVLIGETEKTKQLTAQLYERGFLVTNINYPVVPKGRDEIRVQVSASHTAEDLDQFVSAIASEAKKLAIIK